MLYDQALLAPLYLRAAGILEHPEYRAVARETLDFMVRELGGEGGGFISSLSALDGAGVEGGYYLWRVEELDRLLTPGQRRLLALVWGLEGPARHEAGLLPVAGIDLGTAAQRLRVTPEDAERQVKEARERLAAARERRTLPRDGKQLAGWNGLALSALAAGVRAFGEEAYREAGEALRAYLTSRLWDGRRLHRAVSEEGPIGEAGLEDYAFVARGLKDWGLAVGSKQDLALVGQLTEIAWERFRADGGWRLTDTALLPGIPPETALADSPLPSPAAVLMRLSLQSDDARLQALSREALRQGAATVAANPFAFADHAALLSDPAPQPGAMVDDGAKKRSSSSKTPLEAPHPR
jgi:uncharacterized protein YyaL (SSP411 family)